MNVKIKMGFNCIVTSLLRSVHDTVECDVIISDKGRGLYNHMGEGVFLKKGSKN